MKQEKMDNGHHVVESLEFLGQESSYIFVS